MLFFDGCKKFRFRNLWYNRHHRFECREIEFSRWLSTKSQKLFQHTAMIHDISNKSSNFGVLVGQSSQNNFVVCYPYIKDNNRVNQKAYYAWVKMNIKNINKTLIAYELMKEL